MLNKEKDVSKNLLEIKSQRLSDEELDKVSGGKKVWIEPIKPQTEQ